MTMSDPNYNAAPHGGYAYDENDYRSMEVETIVCAACGCVIPKDDAERDEGDTVYLCAEDAEAIRKMNAGWVA
jgi:transcription initiation factor TFIIIB Brf1 subunit/transcription initiation factor TFIIB